MKAISIRQPWAWAIVSAGKRVENRDWKHPPRYRGPVLLHAAQGCTRDEYEKAWHRMASKGLIGGIVNPNAVYSPLLADLPRGGIVGRATLIDIRPTSSGGHRVDIKAGVCLLCGMDLWHTPGTDLAPCPKPDPWAIPGQFGLILTDVEPVPFVPLKGMLGLFDVKGEDLRAVEHALGGAR
jgi:hypothetical protein